MRGEKDFLTALKDKALLCDGAMGTMLRERGADSEICLEYTNISQPDMVLTLHKDYISAGADIIETNTFGANRFKLAVYGLEDRVADINRQAAKLARQAAGDNIWVLGAVGPIGLPLIPVNEKDRGDIYEAYREQIEALCCEGVDAIIAETMGSTLEAEMAIKAAKDAADIPVICQFSLLPDGFDSSGESLQSVAEFLKHCNADVVGLNCGSGPRDMVEFMKFIAEYMDGSKFLSIQPNAGFAYYAQGRLQYKAKADYFASYVKDYIGLKVNIIGGCCGTTPQHIAAMRSVLNENARLETSNTITVEPGTITSEVSRSELTQLGIARTGNILEKIERKFVVTVEMDPPKGTDIEKALEGARALKSCGVDAVNIADSPMARVRVSPIALATRIKQEVGLDAILHFTCRDRNLIGIQSELIGAAVLGINNVLALTGDPPSIGDHPKATGVFDITSEGLVYILDALNRGRDYMGNALEGSTNFAIGVAFNPNADDPGAELEKLAKKIENGANFIQTQPIYDMQTVEKMVKNIADYNIPVLMGILPLRSYKHAEFLHNEVPGITIPLDIRQRMKNAGDNALDEGVAIAAELIKECRGMVSGVYIMPPFGRYDMVEKIMAEIAW
jgi:homocysteine S-methyltransferase